MNNGSPENKLLARLFIDYSGQSEDIKTVNALLASLGKNIDLDMTEIVEKQVKRSLASLISEVKRTTEQTVRASAGMKDGFKTADTQIKDVIKTVRTLNSEGVLVRKTLEGLDTAGDKVREVVTADGLKSRTISTDGDYKKRIEEEKSLMKELVSEQKAYVAAEKALMKELEAEQAAHIKAEAALMRELEAEQDAYIRAIQERDLAEKESVNSRNRNVTETEYRTLFDQIEEKERLHAQVIADLKEEAAQEQKTRQLQIQATEELIRVEREAVDARNRSIAESEYKQLFDQLEERARIHAQVIADLQEEAEAEKRARKEQVQAIDDLEKAERATLDTRNRAQTEREYQELFDSIGLEEYLASQDKQVALTKELRDAENKRDKNSENIDRIKNELETEKRISSELLNQNSALSKNAQVKKKTSQLAAEQKGYEEETKERIKEQEKYSQRLRTVKDQIVRSFTHLLVMYAEDAIRKFWQGGWEYAQKYYDLLNEIRIVTGQTESEADKMGKVYRKMAKDMSTSSTEIASAAVEFWRQGLDDSEVNSRQVNTTQYAKISGLEFKEAAELVTAATNSMDLDARRVVDVFAYLGKQHCPQAA